MHYQKMTKDLMRGLEAARAFVAKYGTSQLLTSRLCIFTLATASALFSISTSAAEMRIRVNLDLVRFQTHALTGDAYVDLLEVLRAQKVAFDGKELLSVTLQGYSEEVSASDVFLAVNGRIVSSEIFITADANSSEATPIENRVVAKTLVNPSRLSVATITNSPAGGTVSAGSPQVGLSQAALVFRNQTTFISLEIVLGDRK